MLPYVAMQGIFIAGIQLVVSCGRLNTSRPVFFITLALYSVFRAFLISYYDLLLSCSF